MPPTKSTNGTPDRMSVGTHFYSSTTLCHGTPEEVHKTFLKRVWWEGGMPSMIPLFMAQGKVIQNQKDDAGTGAIREVMGFIKPIPLFIHEEIFEAKLGEYIKYRLAVKGMFFATYHAGEVLFYAAGPDMTRVTWNVSYTPKLFASGMIAAFVRSFPLFLYELRIACEPKSKRGGSSSLAWRIVYALLIGYLLFIVSRLAGLPRTGPVHPGPAYMEHINAHRAATKYIDSTIKRHTFLVLGGMGFTGSGVVDELLARGAKGIHVLGRSFPPSIEYPYHPGSAGRYPLKGVEYFRGDITDVPALRAAMQGVTVVIHTAASYGDPNQSSVRPGHRVDKVNVGGMENVLSVAKELGTVSQIVYISSADMTFTFKHYTNATETAPYHSIGDRESVYAEGKYAVGDHYSRTKILAEKLLLSKDKESGIRTISLRPNGIFGPTENSAFPKAIFPFYVLGIAPVYFDLDQRADWTCVYNLVYSTMLAVYKLDYDPSSVGGKAYYITDGDIINTAGIEIFKPYLEALGVPVRQWIRVPNGPFLKFGWATEVVHDWFLNLTGIDFWFSMLTYKEALKSVTTHTHSIERAKKDLGYSPVFTSYECMAHGAEELVRRVNRV